MNQGPLDRNVLIPGETYNELMYSGCFPVYPTGVQLRHNPSKNNVDFACDSNEGKMSEDDENGSEDLRNSSGRPNLPIAMAVTFKHRGKHAPSAPYQVSMCRAKACFIVRRLFATKKTFFFLKVIDATTKREDCKTQSS